MLAVQDARSSRIAGNPVTRYGILEPLL